MSSAAAALQAHASRATPIPDGVVPAELLTVLTTIGVPAGTATKAAAKIVVAQCEGGHMAQLTSCRRNAAHLRAIGIPIPRTDGTPSLTHPCARCNTHCTVLFLVRRDIGVRAAAMVDDGDAHFLRRRFQPARLERDAPSVGGGGKLWLLAAGAAGGWGGADAPAHESNRLKTKSPVMIVSARSVWRFMCAFQLRSTVSLSEARASRGLTLHRASRY